MRKTVTNEDETAILERILSDGSYAANMQKASLGEEQAFKGDWGSLHYCKSRLNGKAILVADFLDDGYLFYSVKDVSEAIAYLKGGK